MSGRLMRMADLLRLSRFDKPTGICLLALPCWIGLAFARLEEGGRMSDAGLAVVFGIGAAAMRGAGCVYNDILDRGLDAEVARTRNRPLASGAVGLGSAIVWMLVLCAVGLAVVWALPGSARMLALASIPLVAAYPLMKRWTNWPQAWLGLTFNWGALLAIAAVHGAVGPAGILLYLALACWTIGYDTIYALQDRDDDDRLGIGSTARLFGQRVRAGTALFYGLSVAGLGAALLLSAAPPGGYLGVALFALCLGWQLWRVRPDMGEAALPLFKANVPAAALLVAVWVGTSCF